MRSYWQRRHGSVRGIRAVGNLDHSERENQRDYALARARLVELVQSDFDDTRAISVLDIGFGQGHDAAVMRSIGVERYTGLDFAACAPGGFPPGFRFLNQDISALGLDLGERFSLVLLLDVAFHLVEQDAFDVMIANVRRHALGSIYVTGQFRELRVAPHVLHRSLAAFCPLGDLIDVQPWRDTLLLRIAVP